jgi:hypothetical protein
MVWWSDGSLSVWWVRCQDREEAVGLYYAANNLMSLTFLSCIELHCLKNNTPSWQLRYGYAVGYVADDQGENMVAWHLNILNTIDVLVIQGWLAYRCFWYWYCGHRAQQMHNRKTWLGRQAWPYLFMSSCIIWRRLERECWSLDLDVAWLPKAKGSPWAILVPFCCLFHCCVSVHHDNI